MALPFWGQVDFQANTTDGCSPLGVSIEVVSPDAGDITSYSWTVTAPDGTVETSNSPLYVAIFEDPGGYDVSLTINGTDNLTIEDYITVFESPVADYTIDDNAGCWPHCVVFTDQSDPGTTPIVEWVWDFGNGQVANEASPSFCYDNPGTYTPVLSIENASGCFDDISFSGLVFVSDEFPQIDISPDAPLTCEPPVEITFSNASSGASDLIYEWTFGDGSSTTTADNSDVPHIYTGVDVYDVCVTATDDIGCQSDSCFTVEVFTTAQASFTATSDLVCENETVSFESSTFPQPVTVNWDFDGDGTWDAVGDSTGFVYTTAGNYTVAMEAIYSTTCSDIEYMAVEVVPGLLASFTSDTTVSCLVPFEVDFVNASDEFGTINYSWIVDGAEVGTTEDLTYTFDAFGNYDVQLDISNEFGCTSSYALPSPVFIQAPSVSFSTSSTICTGETVPILGVTVDSLDPVSSWAWDFDEDGVADDTSDSPDFSFDASGEYLISVEIWTEQGCYGSSTSNSTLTIQDAVEPEFTVSDTLICAEQEVEFCIPYQPGVTHSWNWGDGSGWDTFSYIDSCVTHNYIDTGWVDITLSIWNGGCNHFGTVDSVLYVNAPIAEYEIFHNCDNPMSIEFLDTSIGSDSLYWDFDDGSPLLYNDPNPSHVFAEPGTYYVTLWVYNFDTECADDRTRTVRVGMPDPTIYADPTEGCPPLAVNFEVENTRNDYWEVDFGNSVTMIATSVGNNWTVTVNDNGEEETYTQSGNNWWPEVVYNELGSFDITVNTIDEWGCEADTVLVDAVSVSSNPDFADFNLTYIDACDSIAVSLVPLTADLADWTWTFSDGTTSDMYTPEHTFEAPYADEMSVTLTAVDQLGCNASSTVVLDLVLPPVPGFTVDSDPSCQGEEIQLLDASTGDIASWTWNFGNPADGDANISYAQNPVQQYDTNGSFEICLSVENSTGCVQTLCQPNLVNVINPIADFTFDAEINNCLFGVSFESTSTGDIVGTEWGFGDDQDGIGVQVFHTYNIGVYDLELVVTNDIGCTDTLLVPDILGYGDVIGPFSVELDSVICAPFELQLEAFNVNDTEFEYFWDFGDGFGDPSGVTITDHLYNTPGTYCPSLIMTDENGCPVLVECETEITVIPLELELPVVEAFCSGDSALVMPSGATSYTWNEPEWVTLMSDGVWAVHPEATSTLTLTGQLADCVADTVLQVPVLPLPVLTLDLVDEVCHFDAPIDLDMGLPAGPSSTYYVNGDQVAAFDPAQNPGESYTVTYTYTDEEGCFNSIDETVFIHPLPEVDLAAFPDLCEDDATVFLQGGAPVGGEFQVDGVDAFEFLPSTGYGEYEVEYIYTDENGCINSDVETLEVYPIPVVDFDLESLCFDGSLSFINDSYVPEGTITESDWDFGVLGSSEDFFPGDIGVFAAGSYDVTLELASAFGCDAELTQTFVISPLPEAAFELENGCVNATFDFTDASTVESGTITDWTWEVETFGQVEAQNASFDIDDWGVYNVTLTVSTADGCVDTTTGELQVYPYPEVEWEVGGNCEDTEIAFVNESSAPASDIELYTWDFGDGTEVSNLEDPTHIFESGGNYGVTLTVLSEYGCESTLTEPLWIDYLPVPAVTLSEEILCEFGQVVVNDASTVEGGADIISWLWQVDGNVMGQDSLFVYNTNIPGNYDLTLVVGTDAGCLATFEGEGVLQVYPIPEALFTYGPEDVDVYDEGVQFNSYSADAILWEYDFGDGTTEEIPDPFHVFPDAGEYDVLLTVTNLFGCSDTMSQVVSIDAVPMLFVPTAFTPDNDGVNDYWGAYTYGFEVEAFEMQVFNRWGEVVFRSTQPEQWWNGSHNQGDHYVPEGVYTWRAKYLSAHDGEQHVRTGHVTLIR